jgi:hypothetical protein
MHDNKGRQKEASFSKFTLAIKPWSFPSPFHSKSQHSPLPLGVVFSPPTSRLLAASGQIQPTQRHDVHLRHSLQPAWLQFTRRRRKLSQTHQSLPLRHLVLGCRAIKRVRYSNRRCKPRHGSQQRRLRYTSNDKHRIDRWWCLSQDARHALLPDRSCRYHPGRISS